jgi:hypothetical protein
MQATFYAFDLLLLLYWLHPSHLNISSNPGSVFFSQHERKLKKGKHIQYTTSGNDHLTVICNVVLQKMLHFETVVLFLSFFFIMSGC